MGVRIHFRLSVSQERTSSKIHGPKMEHEMEQAPVARKTGIIAFTTNGVPCELSSEEVEQACLGLKHLFSYYVFYFLSP